MKKFLLQVAGWNFLIIMVMNSIKQEPVANVYIVMFLLLPLVIWYLNPPRNTDDQKEEWGVSFAKRSFCLFMISFVWFNFAAALEVFGHFEPGFAGTGYPTMEHYNFLWTDICHQYGGMRM